MDHFCTNCGKPLPVNGICPCGKNIPDIAPPYVSSSDVMWDSMPPTVQRDTEFFRDPPKVDRRSEELYDEYDEEFYEEEFDESESVSNPVEEQEDRRDLQTTPRFFDILLSYCKDPLETCLSLAQDPQLDSSLSLIFVTVCLSALGTLLLGTLYLEDFFFRWFCVGLAAPIAAFGGSFLFALLLALSERRSLYRNALNAPPKLNISALLSTVATSSSFPILLLTVSTLLSPMDKSLQLFQFFALLILITWVVSLILGLFAVYRIRFRPLTLLLSIGFLFLALVTMRSLWVWFLTGEFRFALYLPLSLFFGGF